MKKFDNPTVLIIGAGLAGLTAARQILKQKPQTNVIVLEALDRVGGRTYSVKVQGTTYDLGAQWIGGTQRHALELAVESNLVFVPQDHEGKKILDFNGKPVEHPVGFPIDFGITGHKQFQWVFNKLDRMAKKVPRDNPSNCKFTSLWDSITVADWTRKNIWHQKVRKMIQILVRSVLAVQSSQISLLYFLWYVNQNQGMKNLTSIHNGLLQTRCKDGMQHMSLFLQKKIQEYNGRIILNTKVHKVIQVQNKVKVLTQDAQIYEGDYIIVSCPPAQVNRITFQPQLSTDRRYLNSKNFMGLAAKVIVLYKEQFWKQRGYSGQIFSDCLESPITEAYDYTHHNEKGELQPAILTFVNGGIYREWISRQDMEKAIIKKYAEYFKCEEMLNPIATKWFAWDQVDTVGGGYTAVYGPGTLKNIQNFSIIRKPQGKIHWAGTQTALISSGHMDGAIESGKRVSKQIIEKLSNPSNILQKVKKEEQINSWYQQFGRRPSL